jgi:transcriptional regulator with PAS, ATPase and Fis domain
VANETIEDVLSVGESAGATPVIVMVHTGTTPVHRVFPVVGEVRLGREIVCGGRTEEVDDQRMSREHASVRFIRDVWRIADLGSTNHTFVNGEQITGEVVVGAADVVLRLGHTVFILVRDGRGYTDTFERNGDRVVGPELARVYEQVRRDAAVNTLLLQGENGAGKELVARLYHESGPRKNGPFVAVNCANIQASLAEAQLFGSRKGAFSDARDTPGYIQSAHGGTLFLDEIAELSRDVQSKLLRVIENREVTPLGASAAVAVDVGVVAASHRNLRKEVATGTFREDLFYRVSHDSVIRLPPLRERRVDIARLVIRELAATDRSLVAHARLIEVCCHRFWPGNVRELLGAAGQASRRALAAYEDNHKRRDRDGKQPVVRPEDLPEDAGNLIEPGAPAASTPDRAAKARPTDYTKEDVLAALEQAKGNVSAATRALKLQRTQMYRLMDRYRIKRDKNDDDDDDDDDDD